MKILECGVWFGPILDVRRFVGAIRWRACAAETAPPGASHWAYPFMCNTCKLFESIFFITLWAFAEPRISTLSRITPRHFTERRSAALPRAIRHDELVPIVWTRAKSYEDWLWTSPEVDSWCRRTLHFIKKIDDLFTRVYRPSLLSLFAHLNACDVTHTRVAYRCLIPCLSRMRGYSLASVASRVRVGYRTLVC